AAASGALRPGRSGIGFHDASTSGSDGSTAGAGSHSGFETQPHARTPTAVGAHSNAATRRSGDVIENARVLLRRARRGKPDRTGGPPSAERSDRRIVLPVRALGPGVGASGRPRGPADFSESQPARDLVEIELLERHA